ncbi:MAG: hypothetical protein AAB372_00795 [Patescibacteria group bacterium]
MIDGIIGGWIAFCGFLIGHALWFHYGRPTRRWVAVEVWCALFFIMYTVWFWRMRAHEINIEEFLFYLNGVAHYIFLFFSYAQFYFLVDRGVSARILVDVLESGSDILSRDEIRHRYVPDVLQDRRLTDMVYGGYLVHESEGYRMTAKGRLNARVFRWAKRFLRLYPGG